MRVSLSELQKIVNQAVDAERLTESFRNEVNRVLGPAVIAEGKAKQIAEAANERIDVLEQTGRASRLSFDPSVTVKLIEHADYGVRKFAARTVPEKFLYKMTVDKNHAVRSAVARRIPLNAVSEMLKRFPKDDALHLIYKHRKINEAGIAQPKTVDEPFDMYGEKRLGTAAKQDPGSELSETWYDSLAQKLVQDYGRTMDTGWQNAAVRRYCASSKATNGVVIDEIKLLDAVNELMEEKEDEVLKNFSLKETLTWLNNQSQKESSVIPEVDLRADPVRELASRSLTPQQFIDEVNELFDVRFNITESASLNVKTPSSCRLPHGTEIRPVDERVLDAYCKNWSTRRKLQGESSRLDWSVDPRKIGKISFSVVSR